MASKKAKFMLLFSAKEEIPWYLTGGVPSANCIGAWQPSTALTLASSYVNLITPGTHDLIAGSTAPTLDGGWVANGAAYLVSDITELATWTTIIKYSGIDTGDFKAPYGAIKADWSAVRMVYNVPSGHAFRNGSIAADNAVSLTTGIVAIANDKTYINGVEDLTVGGLANTNLPFYILCGNSETTPTFTMTQGKILAFATYNITLTQAQIQAIGAKL